MIKIRCIVAMYLCLVSKDIHDRFFSKQRFMVLCPLTTKLPLLNCKKRKLQTVIRTLVCPSLVWLVVCLEGTLMCSITCFESFSCYFSIYLIFLTLFFN